MIDPYQLVEDKAREMIPNWTKIDFYDILTEYFTGSPKFTARGYDLKKGLHCIGPVGTGKTQAFEVFRELLRSQITFFKMIESRHLVRDYKSQNDAVIDKYGRHAKTPCCFDELGLEEQGVRVFGNTTNVMAEIMADRYQLYIRTGLKTYTISNLGMKGFGELYGPRMADRIKEMSNIIEVNGESFRK